MPVIGSDSLVSRSARGAMYQLSELLHVCAVYLGIAVLVTVALSVTVPSLREQAKQVHAALVLVLRPDGLKDDVFATLNSAEAPTDVSAASQLNFSKALIASVAGQPIAGVTAAQEQALRSYIARKYKIAHSVAGALINTAFLVGKETKLDPQLLLAVIAIESRYNPYAESHVGAQGLMQVMTRVHKEKFEGFNEGLIAALNPIANMRVGSLILRDCIKRRGSVEGGLACYVGATGPTDGGYGAKVLAERRRIALASGIPIGR
ncbi:MAG TPA: lytic transglycosylase domain-containing protein [Candidimonas sp.]|nr:lytic transglycosylase domain-containing protein [Candidimonas sp.]